MFKSGADENDVRLKPVQGRNVENYRRYHGFISVYAIELFWFYKGNLLNFLTLVVMSVYDWCFLSDF